MARNSSGTYSLPAGNPVVSGGTISSTVENNTMSDVATELTDSLSRTGKGPMLAALELVNGSVGTPALSFDSDPDTGLYRIGANNPGLAVNGVLTQSWATTGSTLPLGLVVTQSQSSFDAIEATAGAGDGSGINATGGDTDGVGGIFAAGGGNAYGVSGLGAGTGAGVRGFGGTTGPGGHFTHGTAATGGTRQGALLLSNGDLFFTGTANPTSTTAVTNGLTPSNIIKSHGNLTTGAGGGAVTVNGGFNVASATAGSNIVTVTMASAMANTAYTVVVSHNGSAEFIEVDIVSSTVFTITVRDSGGTLVNLDAVARVLHFMVTGAQ